MNNMINIGDRVDFTFSTSEEALTVTERACEKKSVNSVFYDYIFTYPAL